VSLVERVYRAALRAYPAGYRAERGEEVLGTLLEVSRDRRMPDLREVGSLVANGLRQTVRSAPWGAYRASAPWAAQALALLTAAVAILGVMREDRLAGSLPPSLGRHLDMLGLVVDPWFAAFALTAVGTLATLALSARRTALVLALAGLAVQLWEVASNPAVPLPGAGGHFAVYAWTDISTLPREPWHWLVPSLVLPACIALSPRSRTPRLSVRAARLAAVVAVAGGMAIGVDRVSGGVASLIVVLVPLALLALAVSPVDPRPALACQALVIAALPLAWTYSVADPTTPAWNGTLVAAGIAVVALALSLAGSTSARRLRGQTGTRG